MPQISMSKRSQQELIRLSREVIEVILRGEQDSYKQECNNSELQEKLGCFVTLKKNGELRGCVGLFSSDYPLWRTVQAVSVSSAFQDQRFEPVSLEELPDLEIEISILSPMQEISNPLEEIELGRDGIVITDKGGGGTFLPQVATEQGWTLEQFLGYCSRDKAGLGWDGWKSPTAKIFTYTTTIIEEEKE